MERNLELTRLIYGKYRSMSECAKAIGISRQRLYSFVCGRTEPPLQVVVNMASVFGKTVAEIIEIFLAFKSTESTK